MPDAFPPTTPPLAGTLPPLEAGAAVGAAVAGLVAPEGEGVVLGLVGTLLPAVAGLEMPFGVVVVVVLGDEAALGTAGALGVECPLATGGLAIPGAGGVVVGREG